MMIKANAHPWKLSTSPVKATRGMAVKKPTFSLPSSHSPRKNRSKLVYLTPTSRANDVNNQNAFFNKMKSAPSNEFLSKFLYYETLLLKNKSKESSMNPERLENVLDCLYNLKYFMRNNKSATDLFNLCFNEIKRTCTAEYFTNDDTFTTWKRVPTFMALKNVEREHNNMKQHMEEKQLRLNSTIKKKKLTEEKYKEARKMERSMKIKLQIAERGILTKEKHCKELQAHIMRLEKYVTDISGALKDAREIIVENGIVPVRLGKKKANNNLKLNTSPKEITGLLYSDAFQRSLNNVNKFLNESNI